MCDAVRDVRALYRPAPISDFESTFALLQSHANILYKAYRERNAVVKFQISCWHPKLVGKKLDEIFDCDFSPDDAQLTLAREFGFEDVESARTNSTELDQEFECCVDLCLAGNVDELKKRLDRKPDLVSQRSSFGHGAQLLHYLGANGVETWRQIVSLNIVQVAQTLLATGADPAATFRVYGGQFDTLAMVQSSAHPKEAGVEDRLTSRFTARNNKARNLQVLAPSNRCGIIATHMTTVRFATRHVSEGFDFGRKIPYLRRGVGTDSQ